MNKKILIYCFTALLCYWIIKPVFAAQEIDDYLYQYEQYQNIYNDFSVAKNAYLKYQTLSSQNDVREALKKLAGQRNFTLRAYFLALMSKLRTTPGVIGNAKQQELISLLDKEVGWLEAENDQVEKLATPILEDLFVISDRTEIKNDYFKSLSYQSLSLVLLGKIRNIQSESVATTNLLSDELEKKEATQSAQLRDWLKEVENKNYLSQKEIEAAEKNQESLAKKTREVEMPEVFSEIKANLKKAKEYLNQALTYQQEINLKLMENQ